MPSVAIEPRRRSIRSARARSTTCRFSPGLAWAIWTSTPSGSFAQVINLSGDGTRLGEIPERTLRHGFVEVVEFLLQGLVPGTCAVGVGSFETKRTSASGQAGAVGRPGAPLVPRLRRQERFATLSS